MKTPLRSARFAIFTAVAFALAIHSPLHAEEKPAPPAQQKKLTPEEEKQIYEVLAAVREAEKLIVQGKYGEAEKHLRAMVKVMERVLGAEHPDTLGSRNNLADNLEHQGKHTAAEQEHRAVLKIQERVLGAEHPDTAQSCHDLAVCLEAQDKLPEALALMQRAERDWTKILGADHLNSHMAKAGRELIEAKMKR